MQDSILRRVIGGITLATALCLIAPPAQSEAPPVTVIPAPDPVFGARFTSALASDGELLVAGSAGTNAAYVYRRTSGTFQLEGTLRPPLLDPVLEFGRAVDVEDDLIVVGAVDGSLEAAYVFRNTTQGWQFEQRLATPEVDAFGFSVGVSGGHVVVGAPAASGGAGAVHLYEQQRGNWVRTDTLGSPLGPTTPRFGEAVAVENSTLIVGAPATQLGSLGGTAFAFGLNVNNDTWEPVATLRPILPQLDDRFGHAVSYSSGTAVVGAPGTQLGSDVGVGEVYTFRKMDDREDDVFFPGIGPSPELEIDFEFRGPLERPQPFVDGAFGESVDILFTHLIVGAPGDDLLGDDTGAAFSYTSNDNNGEFLLDRRLEAVAPELGARFGSTVASGGFFAVIGAPMKLGGGTATIFDPVLTVDAVTQEVEGFLWPRRAAYDSRTGPTTFNADGTFDLGQGAINLELPGTLWVGDDLFDLPSGLQLQEDGSYRSVDDDAVELRVRPAGSGSSKHRFDLTVHGVEAVTDAALQIAYDTEALHAEATIVLRGKRFNADRARGRLDAPDMTLRRVRANEAIGGFHDVSLAFGFGNEGPDSLEPQPLHVEFGSFSGDLPAEAFTASGGTLRFNDRSNPIAKVVVDAERSRIIVNLREVDIGPFAARPQKMTVTLGWGQVQRSFQVIVGRSTAGLRY